MFSFFFFFSCFVQGRGSFVKRGAIGLWRRGCVDGELFVSGFPLAVDDRQFDGFV